MVVVGMKLLRCMITIVHLNFAPGIVFFSQTVFVYLRFTTTKGLDMCVRATESRNMHISSGQSWECIIYKKST